MDVVAHNDESFKAYFSVENEKSGRDAQALRKETGLGWVRMFNARDAVYIVVK